MKYSLVIITLVDSVRQRYPLMLRIGYKTKQKNLNCNIKCNTPVKKSCRIGLTIVKISLKPILIITGDGVHGFVKGCVAGGALPLINHKRHL